MTTWYSTCFPRILRLIPPRNPACAPGPFSKVVSRLGFRTLLVDGGGGAAGPGGLPLERALACFVGAIPHPEEWQVGRGPAFRRRLRGGGGVQLPSWVDLDFWPIVGVCSWWNGMEVFGPPSAPVLCSSHRHACVTPASLPDVVSFCFNFFCFWCSRVLVPTTLAPDQ